ncbi:MAG: plasmid stabilization protein [Bauldia sp.]|nr:plasmid stabilization protein [Bauldia sp.]
MATLTIRRLDEDVKRRLRLRAAAKGRSMEEEVRSILQRELKEAPRDEVDLGTAIRRIFEPLGGVELELPPRDGFQPRVDFSGPEWGPEEE